MKKDEPLIDRMRHAACHCEGQFDAEWEAKQLRDGADEIVRLMNIAQQVHDRLLRGDSDKELLAILAESWKCSNE